jgi:hypothetical protein
MQNAAIEQRQSVNEISTATLKRVFPGECCLLVKSSCGLPGTLPEADQ